MKSVYILPFLLVLASANFGAQFNFEGIQPLSLFTCFVKEHFNLAVLDLYDVTGVMHSTSFLTNYVTAKEAKVQNIDAVVDVVDTIVPEDVCNAVAHTLPAKFNGTVWLHIQQYWIDSHKQVQFWSLPMEKRIPFLESIVKACQNHGIKTGITALTEDWQEVMGSQTAGSDLLKAVPVWYFHDNGNADFDDFDYAGFGTWDTPTLKTYQRIGRLCDFSAPFVYSA